MLKHRINIRNFRNNDNRINIQSFEIKDLYNTESTNKQLVVCYCDDLCNLQDGSKLVAESTVNLNNDTTALNSKSYDFLNDITVDSVNEEDKLFTFIIDRYHELSCDTISYDIDHNEYVIVDELPNPDKDIAEIIQYKKYLIGNQIYEFADKKWEYIGIYEEGKFYHYFYFDTSHYFENPVLLEDTEKKIVLHIKYTYNGLTSVKDVEMEYITSNVLRIEYDKFDSDIRDVIFDREYNIGNPKNITIYRDQIYYTSVSNFNIYYNKPLETVQIPIEQKFETNLFQSDGLQTVFVDYEKKKAINKITDLEKDVYVPVFHKKDNNNDVIEPIFKIKINLHFREHRGDDWLVSPESYWNGTMKDENGKVDFMQNTESVDTPYFSYDDKSYQSDLLSYLNFVNTDVRYQKNKLRKSFLRLMFYDSVNPANQNLLYYSTIFMDSGKFFTKYVKYIEEKPYVFMNYDDDGNVVGAKSNMEGIRVNREPMQELVINHEDELEEVNLQYDSTKDKKNCIEDLRLSTQFVIQDKYNSTSSCEGYYLYLWKDNFKGVMPQDLYMKVEFNHAGYGRTLPFMMPYWDKNKWGSKNGIKTFEEILNDWNDEWDSVGEKWKYGTDGKYGARQYTKFSYIHFKYCYDLDTRQHIYYLDDDTYGTDYYEKSGDESNCLTINLYEAKMV